MVLIFTWFWAHASAFDAHYVSYQTTIQTTDLDYLHVTVEKHISRRNQGIDHITMSWKSGYSENGKPLTLSSVFRSREETEMIETIWQIKSF